VGEPQLVPERDDVDALVRPLRRHPRAVAHGLEQVADQVGEAMALEVLRERLEQVVLGRLLDVAGDEGDRGVLLHLDRGVLAVRPDTPERARMMSAKGARPTYRGAIVPSSERNAVVRGRSWGRLQGELVPVRKQPSDALGRRLIGRVPRSVHVCEFFRDEETLVEQRP